MRRSLHANFVHADFLAARSAVHAPVLNIAGALREEILRERVVFRHT